jgi:hypothetical protein
MGTKMRTASPVRIIEDDARLFWLAPPAQSFFAYFAGLAD